MRALREPVTVIFARLFAPTFIGCMGLIFGNNPVPESGGKGFLEAIQALAGTLCLGLIYPWGERVPRWCPPLGGRKIPTFLPLVLGGVGNALLYRISATLIIRFGSIWLGLANGWTPRTA